MPRARRALMNRERCSDERGSTLIEMVLATAIMGIAVVGLLVGSSVTFQTSGQNRIQTNAGIVARNYAESLSESVTASNWCQTLPADYDPGYSPPAGYNVTASGSCPGVGQPQFQNITVVVTASGDTETLKTVVRQP